MFTQTSITHTKQLELGSDNLTNLFSIYSALNSSYQSINLLNNLLDCNQLSSLSLVDFIESNKLDFIVQTNKILELCFLFDQFDTNHIYESILNETNDWILDTTDINDDENDNINNNNNLNSKLINEKNSNTKIHSLSSNRFFVEDILDQSLNTKLNKNDDGKIQNYTNHNFASKKSNKKLKISSLINEQQEQQRSEHHVRTSKSSDLNLPAWVFCTRYSDRPSSGKFIISNNDDILLYFCILPKFYKFIFKFKLLNFFLNFFNLINLCFI